ncbi:MAG: hypothetical protein QGI45_00065 [Myxococcota bacterium]|nr:hypothetical protein [Myxococcota bacterium]
MSKQPKALKRFALVAIGLVILLLGINNFAELTGQATGGKNDVAMGGCGGSEYNADLSDSRRLGQSLAQMEAGRQARGTNTGRDNWDDRQSAELDSPESRREGGKQNTNEKYRDNADDSRDLRGANDDAGAELDLVEPDDEMDPDEPDDEMDPDEPDDEMDLVEPDDEMDPDEPDDEMDLVEPDDEMDPDEPDDEMDPDEPDDEMDLVEPDDFAECPDGMDGCTGATLTECDPDDDECLEGFETEEQQECAPGQECRAPSGWTRATPVLTEACCCGVKWKDNHYCYSKSYGWGTFKKNSYKRGRLGCWASTGDECKYLSTCERDCFLYK